MKLAAKLGISIAILDIEVPLPTLREWLTRRQERGNDASEANLDVLEQQLMNREPLTGDELAVRRVVDAERADIEAALGPLLE